MDLPSAPPESSPGGADERVSDDVILGLLGLLALIGLGWGLTLLAGGPIGFDPRGVIRGIAGQLSTTLTAAALTLAAGALNVGSGAVLVRAARKQPFETFGDAILSGFVGAVLLDLILLAALGGVGLFVRPIVIGVHGLIFAIGWWRRRPRSWAVPGAPALALGPATLAWAFVVLAWCGPVVLQLASPVVPFVDVLPNHVAPVEHLRAFGDFSPLTTTASPIYGPSRTFLGYVALLGTVTVMTGLPAALSVAAFVLPATLLVAVGLQRLATAVAPPRTGEGGPSAEPPTGGPPTGFWVLVAFVLATSFSRLADDRATVTVLPLVAWCLATFAERTRSVLAAPAGTRESLLLGGGLAATIFVHPVIGALTAATVVALVLAAPRRTAALGIPALATATILALPQVTTMLGVPVPSPAALLAIPTGWAVGWALVRVARLHEPLVAAGRLLVGAAALGALLGFGPGAVITAAGRSIDPLIESMPLLLAATVVGLVLEPRRLASPVVLAAVAVGLIAATATGLAPDQGVLLQAVRFEVPKTLQYWLPVFVAVAAAAALDIAWRDARLWRALRIAAIGGFLLAAVLPIRDHPIDPYYLGEHRVSETLAVDFRYAQIGYWIGYPDSRRVIRPDQTALVDALRAEIEAGRLGPETSVLHVAASFQQWAATPLGVFGGVVETDAVLDPEVSIHTVGGRLRPIDELDALLTNGNYGYVVWEPASLPADLGARIVAAGYRPIFANGRGEIFVRL